MSKVLGIFQVPHLFFILFGKNVHHGSPLRKHNQSTQNCENDVFHSFSIRNKFRKIIYNIQTASYKN